MRSEYLFFIMFMIGFFLEGNSQHNNFELPLSINDDGSAPDNSALLDVQSTQKGILIPRMSSSERNAIPTPATGLMIFDNNTTSFWYYNGVNWAEIGGGAGSSLLDADGDTGIAVESTVDSDEVEIVVSDSLYLRHYLNPGGVLITDLSSNWANTIIGHQSGGNLTPIDLNHLVATYNTFIGNQAGQSLQTGAENTFVGSLAGRGNVNGNRGTFVGKSAGQLSNEGFANTFIGWGAGFRSEGALNTFIGSEAGWQAESSNLTFIGYRAGNNNTLGTNNTFLGYLSGRDNDLGESNTFVGHISGHTNKTGSFNTLIGDNAGASIDSSDFNTFIGYNSGSKNISGGANTFLGANSGLNNEDGFGNIYIGRQSGLANSEGSNNVFIGSDSGRDNEGSSNIFIGTDAGFSETGSNRLYIESARSFQPDNTSPLIYGEFDNNLVQINGTLNISETAKLIPIDVLTNGEPACGATDKGLLYMNDNTNKLRLCDGTSWVDLN